MDELGKALKLSSGTISNWENYKHDIKGDQLIIVARFFGCSTDYLLGEKDDY
ncbi:MAG: helix-turn-helix domain-containing protein [Firmicutes bacterium]|nr:helix-turn-helix domain-containing protein [Bacillota bacterium]